jgi:flagellar motor switch/type III secretory pathway protein FliN
MAEQATSVTAGASSWERVHSLPCQFTVELSIPAFTVRDLMHLHEASVWDTKWPTSSDLPLLVNGKLIGWGEIEVVSSRLAIRVTQLA